MFDTIRAMASPVKYEFVDKVPEDHQCTVCTNILTNPVLAECCGQHFCKACLDHWLATAKNSCPYCREKINFITSKHMKRHVDSLKMYCPNRSKGCDKITAVGECNQHLKKCLFVEVSCTKKCGERMLRKELQDHEDNKCPNRLVQCQYCNTEGEHKEITANSHLDICPSFPISCPNNCGHEKIQRKKLADHQKVCPLEPVKCPFFEAKCTKLIPRKDLAAHKASNIEHHLELVMTETVTLKQKQEAAKHEAIILKQKLEAAKHEAIILKQKLEAAKHEAIILEQKLEAEKEAMKNEAKIQQQHLSLRFDALAFCVAKQLGTIDSNPRNTQAAIKNIKSSLETMTTMLAPGDTRYTLPLVEVAENIARSASFYVTPGYKMYVKFDGKSYTVYLEKGEHDHKLKWPMSEMEIELSFTENAQAETITMCTKKICTRCGNGVIMNRVEGYQTEREMFDGGVLKRIGTGTQRASLFLIVREHDCKR